MNIDMVLEKLKNIKHKSSYSKYKNAFIKFCSYQDIHLNNEIMAQLKSMKDDKKKKYRKLKPTNLKDIAAKIRVIKNRKLKISFKIMLYCGLRVSELTQIRKNDCIILDDTIEFSFISKGGKPVKVIFHKEIDELCFRKLCELIQSLHDSQKVFYSKSYLQKIANEKKFTCHDLRRAFAKLELKDKKDINKVRTALRHTSLNNTRIYLRSKINIDK